MLVYPSLLHTFTHSLTHTFIKFTSLLTLIKFTRYLSVIQCYSSSLIFTHTLIYATTSHVCLLARTHSLTFFYVFLIHSLLHFYSNHSLRDTLTLSLSYSLSYSLTLILPPSLSHCLTLSHSLSLSLSLTLSLASYVSPCDYPLVVKGNSSLYDCKMLKFIFFFPSFVLLSLAVTPSDFPFLLFSYSFLLHCDLLIIFLF